jgi:hypothetical protein
LGTTGAGVAADCFGVAEAPRSTIIAAKKAMSAAATKTTFAACARARAAAMREVLMEDMEPRERESRLNGD